MYYVEEVDSHEPTPRRLSRVSERQITVLPTEERVVEIVPEYKTKERPYVLDPYTHGRHIGISTVIVEEERPRCDSRAKIFDKHHSLNHRTRLRPSLFYYRLCIGIVLLLLLICLVTFIPVSIMGGSSGNVKCYIATYRATVSMADMTYNDELRNSYSDDFDVLAKDFCKSLNENMEDLYECGDKVESCRVVSFRPGSIIINANIRHTKIGSSNGVSEKEEKRISDVVSEAITKGSRSSNSNNLFRRHTVGSVNVEASDTNEYVQCAPLDIPKRSSILTTNAYVNYVDDSITVQCDRGTYFPGDTTKATVTCLNTGKWNRQLSDCQPKICPDLADSLLQNADLLLGNLTDNEYKDVVMILCNEGFTFDSTNSCDGTRVAVCQDDGKWDTAITKGCTDFDECASDPCANGGSCTEGVNDYTCACPSGYSGKNCEQEISCETATCAAGSTCVPDSESGYKCICAAGYTGVSCDSEIDECLSNPCENGGTCEDRLDEYSCTCPAGIQGINCEIDIDECIGNPCRNGGTCQDLLNDFSCTCPNGAGGKTCETDTVDDCVGVVCGECQSCVDIMLNYYCEFDCGEMT